MPTRTAEQRRFAAERKQSRIDRITEIRDAVASGSTLKAAAEVRGMTETSAANQLLRTFGLRVKQIREPLPRPSRGGRTPFKPRRERASLVAHLARTQSAAGWKVTTDNDPKDANGHRVYIASSSGQLSWHFSPIDADLFAEFPFEPTVWDGHTTAEKYERLAALP